MTRGSIVNYRCSSGTTSGCKVVNMDLSTSQVKPRIIKLVNGVFLLKVLNIINKDGVQKLKFLNLNILKYSWCCHLADTICL